MQLDLCNMCIIKSVVDSHTYLCVYNSTSCMNVRSLSTLLSKKETTLLEMTTSLAQTHTVKVLVP